MTFWEIAGILYILIAGLRFLLNFHFMKQYDRYKDRQFSLFIVTLFVSLLWLPLYAGFLLFKVGQRLDK